jgi:hypothetical protein
MILDDLSKRSADEGLYKGLMFLARGSLGLVPGVGPVAAEILQLIVADPAQKRRDNFLMALARRIELLEKAGHVTIAELAQDERVSATILQAAQIAQRSTGERKHSALKNAATRCICDGSARSLSPIVIGVIDRLTDNHLYILNGLRQFVRPVDPNTARREFVQKYWGTTQPLTIGFVKDNKPKGDGLNPSEIVFKTVWSDLVGMGLIKEGSREGRPADRRRGLEATPSQPFVQITELAQIVLDHIENSASLADIEHGE